MNSASKITIITDSASDMPGNLHNQVTVLPMTISLEMNNSKMVSHSQQMSSI